MKTESSLESFHSANPKARKLYEAQIKEFRAKFAKFVTGLKPLLAEFVDKAESARQIGIVLVEFTDTLPGKKLTADFYQQVKDEFTDAKGQSVPLELLEWFIRVARNNPDPILDFATADKWRQPMLLATGDESFRLTGDHAGQVAHVPPTPLEMLKTRLNYVELESLWKKFTENDKWYENGVIRQDLREVMVEELRPTIVLIDKIRVALGI